MGITFWIAALGIPAALLIGNSIVRALLDMSQSAGADTGLMFVAFDLAVLIQADDFHKYIPFGQFAKNMMAIYGFTLVICVFSWIILVICERKISEYYESKRGLPLGAFFASFFLPVLMIFMNVTPFIYGM